MSPILIASAGLTLRRCYPPWFLGVLALGAGTWYLGAESLPAGGALPTGGSQGLAAFAGARRAALWTWALVLGIGVLLARLNLHLERLRQAERESLGSGSGGPASALRGSLLGGIFAGALYFGGLAVLCASLHGTPPAPRIVVENVEHPAGIEVAGRAEQALDAPASATHLAVPLRNMPGRPLPERVIVELMQAGAGGTISSAEWRPGVPLELEFPGSPETAARVRWGGTAAAPGVYLPSDSLTWLRVGDSVWLDALLAWTWSLLAWSAWCALATWLSAGLGPGWVLVLCGASILGAWWDARLEAWVPFGDWLEISEAWSRGWSIPPAMGPRELGGIALLALALGPAARRLAERRPGARGNA